MFVCYFFFFPGKRPGILLIYRYDCSSFKCISLVCVVGKVYGRMLIKKIREGKEEVICEELGGFRRGRDAWIRYLL